MYLLTELIYVIIIYIYEMFTIYIVVLAKSYERSEKSAMRMENNSNIKKLYKELENVDRERSERRE